jgi:hypothetical protein
MNESTSTFEEVLPPRHLVALRRRSHQRPERIRKDGLLPTLPLPRRGPRGAHLTFQEPLPQKRPPVRAKTGLTRASGAKRRRPKRASDKSRAFFGKPRRLRDLRWRARCSRRRRAARARACPNGRALPWRATQARACSDGRALVCQSMDTGAGPGVPERAGAPVACHAGPGAPERAGASSIFPHVSPTKKHRDVRAAMLSPKFCLWCVRAVRRPWRCPARRRCRVRPGPS